MSPPSAASIDRADIARNGFARFAWLALPHLTLVGRNPRWNWHVEEMCNNAEGWIRSERHHELLVNVPPGSLKSTIFSVLLLPWIWTWWPQHKQMCASYDAGLATSFAKQTLELLESDWYVERWGMLVPEATAQKDFMNIHGGRRFATTPGGGGVGVHGDSYLIDDPIKPRDVMNAGDKIGARLQAVNQWIASSVFTRARPGTPQKIGLVMQRLHEEDAAGFLEEHYSTVVKLRLPARYEPEEPCATPFGGDRRTAEGEPLWVAAMQNWERNVSANGGWDGALAQCQYQQKPRPGASQI